MIEGSLVHRVLFGVEDEEDESVSVTVVAGVKELGDVGEGVLEEEEGRGIVVMQGAVIGAEVEVEEEKFQEGLIAK